MADLFNQILQMDPFFFLKIGVVFVLGLFSVFTFVILNQIDVMNKIIDKSASSGILRIVAFINLIAAISLFLTALVIL